MHFGHATALTDRLPRHETQLEKGESEVPTGHAGVLEPMAERSLHELIERRSVPPFVHVTFAEPEGAPRENAREEPFVMNTDVPRLVAVDANPRSGEHVFHDRSRWMG